jgi:hypothetical protein
MEEMVGPVSNMREGTTLRVLAANGPYGEFYGCDSISLEYFGYTIVYSWGRPHCTYSLRTLVSVSAGISSADMGKFLRLLGI